MLGILLIAISIGTVAVTVPVASFIAPTFDAIELDESIGFADTIEIQTTSLTEYEPKKSGSESMAMSGWVIIEVYDKDGNQKYYSSNHNLIVDKGNEATSDLLFATTHTTGESAGEFTFIQLGTGVVNPATGDTNCGTPAGNKIDGSVANHPTLIGAIINATGVFGNQLIGQAISEVCLTDNTANATGNLFARQEFTPFTFNDGDSVNATWTISMIDHDGS